MSYTDNDEEDYFIQHPKKRSAVLVETLAGLTNLNDAALTTYSSTTSRWDPYTNTIKYANQRRQRPFVVGGTTYQSDLIESARTNLLASGTSEHFERWTVGSGTPVVTTDTIACPNGEVVADTLTEGVGNGTHGVSQSITKAASSLAYVGSVYIKAKTGSREVIVELDDGTLTNGVALRINPATGALTSAPAAFGSGWAVNTAAGTSGYTIESAGSGWYRVSVIATSDSTTTVRFRVALYNAADSYAGDGTSAVYLWGADANQATFAASVNLQRNIFLQSQTLNTSWTKTRSTVTSDAVADPITGDTTADKLVEDGTVTNTHFIGTGIASKATTSLSVTVSGYFKAAERTWIVLVAGTANNSISGTNARAYFDLGNGVTGSSATSGVGWAVSTKTITSLGSGWYRCAITVTTDSSANLAGLVGLSTADNGQIYSGDGASGAYAWGMQMEYGPTATQYWANATVGTRAADVLTSTLTSITDARTNRLTYSEQFDNAAWTKADVTVTANSGTDPNGNGYCDLLTEGVAGTARTSQVAAYSAGAAIAVSCFVKASANATWIRLEHSSNTRVNGWRAWFNVSTGTVGALSAFGTGTATSSSVVNYGNGWYRLRTVGAVDPAATQGAFGIQSADADASVTPVSAAAYYAFGAQIEQASTVGDYIPVGGTAITTGPTGLSRTTGTLVSIVMPRNWTGDQDGGNVTWSAWVGNDSTPSSMRRNAANKFNAIRADTAGSQNGAVTGVLTNGALSLFSESWDSHAVTGNYNGSTSASDSSLAAPFDAVTSLNIGSASAGAGGFTGYVLCLYSHQQVLPGSTLALMYANTTAP